ncbi:phosphosulfolactate synthase [Streptomyces sp. NPDC026672]|uniref:phosphosulfolactate synthase n=1 Tax=unclassified Streptomyces TaxID=2593676 RepID=UPI0033C4A408
MSVDRDNELAFSGLLPIVEGPPKPRAAGLTEVRTYGNSVGFLRGYVDTLGEYVDSVKWAVGTQRLVTRRQVKEINSFLHAKGIEVSSGGLLEVLIPRGEKAVRGFIGEAKELGFDIIEVSTGLVVLDLEDKARIVRAVTEAGLKAKPEVFGAPPLPGGYLPGSWISTDKIANECAVLLEAGAWKVMIEEDGLFDGRDPAKWHRDFAFRLAGRVPQDQIFWEASDIRLAAWLLVNFGPSVNIFTGLENVGQLAAFRSGAFLTSGRIGAFRNEA